MTMKAIVVRPPAPGAAWTEVPDPVPEPGEISVEMLEAGICGTDRDIVAGRYGEAPAGSPYLVLGHENLGRVTTVPADGLGFIPGDLVVSTVRRSCGICRFCLSGRSDFCSSGRFTERGIRGRHGYFAERYTERPEYMVKVPAELREEAVLLEPLSVVEKAYLEGQQVLQRFEPTPGHPRQGPCQALITGTGAIGMLAALLFANEGLTTVAVDRHDDTTPAAKLLSRIGVEHVNVRDGLTALGSRRFDLILEASGNAPLDFELLRYLGPNSVLVLTGIPPAEATAFPVAGGPLLRNVVLENQAIVGSVNANRRYFEYGIQHLLAFRKRWGGVARELVTERLPAEQFSEALEGKGEHVIKSALTLWSAK
jgi:threonine dehydrogenase-like Zn-dependent dehydrogenase